MNNKNQNKVKFKAKELEFLKEDELIELLKVDIRLIKKIKNPSLKIQKMVVQKDISCFKFIKVPDIEVIEYVAKLKPSLLREDMFDIESVQTILLDKNPRYAKKFTRMSDTVKERVAESIPGLLNYQNNERLQRIAFEKSTLSYKYFKDCSFISKEEVMKSNSGLFIYMKNVDKELISDNIECISYVFYNSIGEYSERMLRYMLNNYSNCVSYLSYEKLMKLENISDIIDETGLSVYENMFYKVPYKVVKKQIAKQPILSKVVVFDNENEIFEALESNNRVLLYLKDIPENILIKIPKDLYSKINYFGKLSLETQRELLKENISYAGKIENIDLDLVKEFCLHDDRIIRYLRFMDEELKNYGISNGILNYNEFKNLNKDNLVKSLFLCSQFREENNNVKMVR